MKIGVLEAGANLDQGSNAVAFSWKDKKCIKFTNNGTGAAASTGSLFVEGGSANSLQDINNQWTVVPPIELLPRIDATGAASPYQVSLSSKPAGADFYYTTDGSEPTQSSTRYAGPVSIPVAADRVLWLKAKAFMAGKTPSNTARTLLYPCAIKSVGLTGGLWKNIEGTQVSDLTSNSRYPNNPDRTWTAPNLDNQYGNPWGYVQGDPYSNFGYKLYGYIIAPLTGSYIFKLSSNTSISLRLGTSSDPASAREIAQITLTSTSDPGMKVVSSSPIILQANNWYFVEQILKGGIYWTYNNGSWQVTGQEIAPDMILMPKDSVPRPPSGLIAPQVTMQSNRLTGETASAGCIYDVKGRLVFFFSKSSGVRTGLSNPGVYVLRAAGRQGEPARRIVVRECVKDVSRQ